MARQEEPHRGDPVIAAMEHVLKAEREGVEHLHASRETAERLLTEARAEAASIARRADARISRIHAAYLKKIETEIEHLGQSAPDRDDTVDAHDHATLEAAARRVAAALTGET